LSNPHVAPSAIVAMLASQGIHLRLRSDSIAASPGKLVTDAARAVIAGNRAALIAHLQRRDTAASPQASPLAGRTSAGPVRHPKQAKRLQRPFLRPPIMPPTKSNGSTSG